MYTTYIVPNNFIWDETSQKYKVSFPASTFDGYFNSDYDTYVVKCLRMDGDKYREIILYYEVTETGDLTLFFDETFIARVAISTSLAV